MKATAVALIILSVYWIGQGITAIRQNDLTGGAVLIVMGVVLLPIARYVWGKNLGQKT